MARSATLICGSRQVTWQDFLQVRRSGISPLPAVISLKTTDSEHSGSKSQPSGTVLRSAKDLFGLLLHTRHCKCKDPSDKIFGLLSLFDESLGISADYSMNTTEVFNKVALVLLETVGLGILSPVQGKSSIPGLPTWVPDWSVPQRRTLLGISSSFRAAVSAEDGHNSNYTIHNNAGILTLRVEGKVIGEVQKAGPVFSVLGTKAQQGSVLTQWHLMANSSLKKRPDFMVLRDDDSSNKPDIDGVGMAWGKTNLYEDTKRMWHARTTFVASGDFVGLGPSETQQGDVLCLLKGGRVPYVLRRQGTRYCFVGEALVHGIMDGQLLRNPSEHDLSAPRILETRLPFRIMEIQ
jgi:hypothetical protein